MCMCFDVCLVACLPICAEAVKPQMKEVFLTFFLNSCHFFTILTLFYFFNVLKVKKRYITARKKADKFNTFYREHLKTIAENATFFVLLVCIKYRQPPPGTATVLVRYVTAGSKVR